MKKLPVVLLLLIIGSIFAFPSPVFAIDPPDTTPQVNAVYVFEYDDGSAGVLIDYYLDYAVLPTETATDAYFAVFIDTDGTTQLKAVAPYTFVDSGYGRGMVYIPFTAAEVTSYSLNSTNQADYRIWLTGNPTLAWSGAVPKTIATIDQWNTTGDMAVLLALRVLYYADVLELAWSLDMVESTALGNRLTTVGESYFENVIPGLRTLAPAAFASGTQYPEAEDIDYDYTFGATVTSGTANITGSPVTLTEGSNTITVQNTGYFTITLNLGTSGNITSGTGTITGSPARLVSGANVVTCTVNGTATVAVRLVNAQSNANDTVEGTGFDLTTLGAAFGMSRLVFSGLVWFAVSVLICAATYGWGRKRGFGEGASGSGNATMLMFGICLIGGALLGMLDHRVLAFIAIGYAGLIGYVFFFRNSGGDIGKVIMFMGWMWFVVCLIGGVLAGVNPTLSTQLTADITATDTTITVTSTRGFPETGVIVIGDEKIAYHATSATTFEGSFLRPIVRGANDTTADAHVSGDSVRTLENALLNNSLNYNIALLSDSSGFMAFVSLPLVFWDILTSFIFLPIQFLGTDMEILLYVWALIGLGLLVSIFIAMSGGRRV